MAVASEKVLWSVPLAILYICLPNGCCCIKSSSGGSANCASHVFPSLHAGVKVDWIVDMFQPYESSPQKTTYHVVAVGVLFAFIFSQGEQWIIPRNPSYVKQTLQKRPNQKLREQVFLTFPFHFHMEDTSWYKIPYVSIAKFRNIMGWCFFVFDVRCFAGLPARFQREWGEIYSWWPIAGDGWLEMLETIFRKCFLKRYPAISNSLKKIGRSGNYNVV